MTPVVETGCSPVELWDRARLYDLQLWLEKPALRAAIALRRAEQRRSRARRRHGDWRASQRARGERQSPGGGCRYRRLAADAEARTLGRTAGEWRLEQADARKLPYQDAGFSLVFAAYFLNVLSDEDGTAALREVRRVLVPGGRLLVVTPVAPSPGSAPASASSTPSRSSEQQAACSPSSVGTYPSATPQCACSRFATARSVQPHASRDRGQTPAFREHR